MRPLYLLLLSLAWLSVLVNQTLAAHRARSPAVVPDILVVRYGWEEDRDKVRSVLEGAAAELWTHFPGRSLPPIIVYPQGGQ